MAPASSKKIIGIDLGTTNSCVAVYKITNGKGSVVIIPNSDGERTWPSVVGFTEHDRLVGKAACSQAPNNSVNTVFHVKRLIGKKLYEPEILEDSQNYPFKIASRNLKLGVEVTFRNSERFFTPEEVSAMILQKMKLRAEEYLDCEVIDAVITVPAYFNDGQRQATKDAATIAGLNVIRIINEPTAAALAYGLENNVKKEKNVLVFDLGGGTFDVSIVNITEGPIFEVKSTTGDTHLGGADFDQKLIQYFIDEIKNKASIDVSTNPRAMTRLRIECEKTKIELSSSAEAYIEVCQISKGYSLNSSIFRARFEDLCADLFGKIFTTLERALNDAKLEKSQIDDVVLVGGSTRIPKIKTMLENFFNGKKLKSSINPDEAVAYGAATQAALSSGLIDRTCILRDVTPLSLGLKTRGGVMTNIINRNTVIPKTVTQTFTTSVDNQKSVLVEVYEGEQPMVQDNNLLGTFELDIPPAPRGIPSIEVTFSVDLNGILEVNASETMEGVTSSLVVTNQNGRLSDEDVNRMKNEAEQLQKEELERVGR